MLDKLRDGITLHAEKKAQIAVKVIEDHMMASGPRHRLTVLGMREVVKNSLQEMKDHLAGLPPPMERSLFDGNLYPKAPYNNGYGDFTDQQRDLKAKMPEVAHAVDDFYAVLQLQKFCETSKTPTDLLEKIGHESVLDTGHAHDGRIGPILKNMGDILSGKTSQDVASLIEKHEPSQAEIAQKTAEHDAFMQQIRESQAPSWG